MLQSDNEKPCENTVNKEIVNMNQSITKWIVIVGLLSVGISTAWADENWTENYEEAKQQAKAENKDLFIDFT